MLVVVDHGVASEAKLSAGGAVLVQFHLQLVQIFLQQLHFVLERNILLLLCLHLLLTNFDLLFESKPALSCRLAVPLSALFLASLVVDSVGCLVGSAVAAVVVVVVGGDRLGHSTILFAFL